jgi:hypothetical protein
MKIEFNLQEIFEDEDGECISKSLSERIETAVIERARASIISLVKEIFEKEISSQISDIVKMQLNDLLKDLLDREFVPTGRYGDRGESITLRNRNMQGYRKRDDLERLHQLLKSKYIY